MSGGVDSSVAAYLTMKSGYDCTGVTLKLYDSEDTDELREKTCCSLDDVEDARSVCRHLGIPYFVRNFKESFRENVIERFISAYENGATPNPCIDCNRYIKFEKLMLHARELGMDKLVTGHYARVEYDEERGRYILKKAIDLSKDQSYVLYSLTQEQLSMLYLPLGELTKTETRAIAEQNGFVNAAKRDSQDDEEGNVLGEHKGIIRYTIGQRKGLGLALPHPMYVKEKNLEENKVILCENEALFSKELTATDVNLISTDRIEGEMRVSARVRYNQKEQPATVTQPDGDRIRVVFDEPQRAVCKGQAVVLYDGDTVVGGGVIE